MLQFLKESWKWISAIILLTVILFSIHHTTSTQSIIQLKSQPITSSDKKILPGVKEKYTIIPIKEKTGFSVQTSILQSLTTTIQVSDYKIAKGWSNRIDLGLQGGIQGIEPTLGYTGPFYWRLSGNALLGTKSIGIGIGYNLTNNTILGVSYTLIYSTGLSTPGLFLIVGL